jgi:hypothetical protein
MSGEFSAMKATAEKVKESGIHPSTADAGSFQHIEGLKAGDKLRFLGGPQKTLKKGETITVYRVLEKEETYSKESSQILRFDFTALFEKEDFGEKYLLEYEQDSRYYERVTV